MNCAEFRELLVAYVEGLLDEVKKRSVAEHAKSCASCRAELREASDLRDRLIKNGKILAQSNLENVVLERIIREQNVRLKTATKISTSLKIRRIIMKSRITKLAAAAVIAVAVLLPLSYGATKLIKRFITISQLSAIKEVGFLYRCALSPDGKHFAGVTWNSQLVVIDTSTGEQRNLADDCVGPVVWSADGNEIAVVGTGQEKKTLLAVS
ncbi:MAG: zf-HC2 domain-containing protein, partial [Sedimentisphaerales bacterium]